MCRLFGMTSGAEPATATFWLIEAPDSLLEQSFREPDGTGIGFFDARGTPHVSKQPLAAHDDKRFVREAHELSSRTFIAHIRFASTGPAARENTHPFEQAGRLFAHNGVIAGLEILDKEIAGGPAQVHGQTDSERMFALITKRIEEQRGAVAGGISAAVAWIAENLPLYALNFVLISASELWALRFPDTHELYVLERGTGAELAQHSRLGTRVQTRDARERPLVVVASERMDDDPGWRALASGELLHVDARLGVSSHRVLERAPAHQLSLADLAPRARTSQASHPS
jgi:predicted glutamine amidotransferase